MFLKARFLSSILFCVVFVELKLNPHFNLLRAIFLLFSALATKNHRNNTATDKDNKAAEENHQDQHKEQRGKTAAQRHAR